MLNRKWAVGLLAVTGLLAGAALAQAGDTFRLALPTRDDAPAMKLGQVGTEAEMMDVAWRGGFRGGWGGGFRGWGGGFRGGWGGNRVWVGNRGWGGWGGNRVWVGNRGWGGWGGNRVWIGNPGWGGWGGNRVWIGNPGWGGPCWGISLPTPGVARTFSLNITPVNPSAMCLPEPFVDGPQPPPQGATFDYDGGPRAPVPMPQPDKAQPVPMNIPGTVPLEGRPVSLPARSTPKYTYPAYGEVPRVPADSRDRSLQVKR